MSGWVEELIGSHDSVWQDGCVEIGWVDGVVWSVVVGEKCGEWLNESEHGAWMGGLGC